MASCTSQSVRMPTPQTPRRLRICWERFCGSTQTVRFQATIPSSTHPEQEKKSGRSACEIRLPLPFSQAPRECSSMMSARTPGKRLTTVSRDQIMAGIFVRACVRPLTPTFEIHCFNTRTAESGAPLSAAHFIIRRWSNSRTAMSESFSLPTCVGDGLGFSIPRIIRPATSPLEFRLQ